MLILPAIDLMNGACVRLWKGDFGRSIEYSSFPAQVARMFFTKGFQRIHVVDLDGANNGKSKNLNALSSILSVQGLNVQAGGGIRTREDVERFIALGVDKIIIGSAAILNPETVMNWIEDFGPNRFVIAIDVCQGRIALNGWKKLSDQRPSDAIARYVKTGLRTFLCTDIDRDGTMLGPNIALYHDLLNQFPNVEIQASGGVAVLRDVEALSEMGVPTIIIGKALYERRISLQGLNKFMFSGALKKAKDN